MFTYKYKHWRIALFRNIFLSLYLHVLWWTRSFKKSKSIIDLPRVVQTTNPLFSVLSEINNINWRDVQIKNVANNVDMSSLRAPWQNGPYKN